MKLGCRLGWHDWDCWETLDAFQGTVTSTLTYQRSGFYTKTIQQKTCKLCNRRVVDIDLRKKEI